jgi:hypothetical protein
MFYQNVTHYIPTSNIIHIGEIALLPCPITTGKGLGLAVLHRTLTSWLTPKDNLLQQTLQQQSILPLLQKQLATDDYSWHPTAAAATKRLVGWQTWHKTDFCHCCQICHRSLKRIVIVVNGSKISL